MKTFVIVWIGQIISLLGSAMTGFAVTIWVYEGTEKATALALTGFFWITPLLLLSPVAGAIVDRSNRKLMMMLSDLAAGAATIAVLILHATGHLQVWHLFVTNAISGAFQAFQWPAYSAAISVMLPKEQYARANGMMELAGSGSNIFAPMLAGALLGPLGLDGILLIDIVTFVFAVGTLLFVHIPQPQTTAAGREGQGSLWTESFYGLRYIVDRPSLLGLQLVFLLGNFVAGLAFTVFAALILARTGNDELVFGSVQSAGAIGGVAGGLAMTAWGGPKHRVHGVLGGWAFSGLTLVLLGLGRSLPVWAVASFLGQFLVPILNGSNQAIWQAKVAPDVQGRVFSMRRLIAWFVSPLSALLAGPLADLLLEPAMREGGALADVWGGLVGTGPGAGMALIFVLGGGLSALVGLSAYTVRVIRDAEALLPDHDAPEAQMEPAPAEAPVRTGWTARRKVAAALGSVALALSIVGLGWLQVKVLTAADTAPSAEVIDVTPQATLLPSPTPSPPPTVTPSP
jgi:MFS family permease